MAATGAVSRYAPDFTLQKLLPNHHHDDDDDDGDDDDDDYDYHSHNHNVIISINDCDYTNYYYYDDEYRTYYVYDDFEGEFSSSRSS